MYKKMVINNKSSLLRFLKRCRNSHKPWANKNKSRRYISPMSADWNTKVVEEYQEAIDFIDNNLKIRGK